MILVSVETYWNLNVEILKEADEPPKVSVETYWNLNAGTIEGQTNDIYVSVETYWNLNQIYYYTNKDKALVSVETYWNLNNTVKANEYYDFSRISRNILEFKYIISCYRSN